MRWAWATLAHAHHLVRVHHTLKLHRGPKMLCMRLQMCRLQPGPPQTAVRCSAYRCSLRQRPPAHPQCLHPRRGWEQGGLRRRAEGGTAPATAPAPWRPAVPAAVPAPPARPLRRRLPRTVRAPSLSNQGPSASLMVKLPLEMSGARYRAQCLSSSADCPSTHNLVQSRADCDQYICEIYLEGRTCIQRPTKGVLLWLYKVRMARYTVVNKIFTNL